MDLQIHWYCFYNKFFLFDNFLMDTEPKTSAELFSDILKLQNEGSLPPVDDWDPPLCENVQMKITRDGKWSFMNSRMRQN